MATPTLNAYRQLNPQDTRPDEEVVPDLIGRLQAEGTVQQYPDLLQYASDMDRAYRQAHPPGLVREFTRSFGGGMETGESQLYSALAQGSDVAGLDTLRDWALRGYQRHAEKAATAQPTVPTVSDIHSAGDALRYGVGLAGSQAPALAATVGAGLTGAAIGTLAGPEGTVGGALTGLGTAFGAAPEAAAAVGGSTAGLLGAGYLQSQNYGQLTQQGAQDAALTSAMVGAAGGLLMTIVPSNVLRKAFGAETQSVAQLGVDSLLHRAEDTVPGLGQSILQSALKHGSNNALLGVGSELVSMAGEMYANRDNPNFQISDKELTDRILNGAAAGGVIGAGFGVLGANGERKQDAAQIEYAKRLLEARRQDALSKAQSSSNPAIGFVASEGAMGGMPSDLYNVPAYTNPQTGEVQPARSYADYTKLFDDAADQEEKRQARVAYDQQREVAFRQSERQAELPRNQLSQQAGGTEISPVDMTPKQEPPGEPQQQEPTPAPAPVSPQARNTTQYKFEPAQSGPFISELPRKLIDLANNPRGSITPNANGEVPAKSLPGILRKLGTSKAEYEVYKDVIDSYTKSADGKVNLPQLAQALEGAAPRIEVKELYPYQLSKEDAGTAQAQHRLETAGFRIGDVGEIFNPDGELVTSPTEIQEYGNQIASDVDLILRRHPGKLSTESDAATGRFGVEPKPLEQMPGAVDLLVRLPNKLESGWMVHDEKDVPVQPFKTEEEAKKWIGDNPGFSVKKWSKVDFRNPLFEGPHFGRSDKNVLASVRAYREGDTLHVFEVQSDWGQRHREDPKNINGHPLLHDYETLAVKAAIDYAQKHGLKKIALSDAETAMMTEGHDRATQIVHDQNAIPRPVGEPYEYNWRFQLPHGWTKDEKNSGGHGWVYVRDENGKLFAAKPFNMAQGEPKTHHELDHAMIGSGLSKVRVFVVPAHEQVTQEKGMRAAYDERLPNILRKLTGDRGQMVDLGQHKTAGLEEGTGAPVPGEPMARQPGSPVFRNQFGPKDNITARIFRLDKVKEGQKSMFDGPKVNPKTGFVEEIGALHQSDFGGSNVEHAGDIPAEPLVTAKPKVENTLPEIREEATRVANMSPEKIVALGADGIRKDEGTRDSTKRLIAVENLKTGKVEAYPLYIGSGHDVMVNNGIEERVTSRAALADVLGYDRGYVTRKMRENSNEGRAFEKIWSELNTGKKDNQTLQELLADKNYAPLALINGAEPVGQKHYVFDSVERFNSEIRLHEQNDIVSKGGYLGTGGVEPILQKLTKLSPADAKGVQVLASILESQSLLQDRASGVEAQRFGNYNRLESEIRSDPTRVLRGLLRNPGKTQVFQETLAKLDDPNELLGRSNGKLFGLFSKEEWENFKKEIERPDITAQELLNLIDAGLGGKTRADYIDNLVKKQGGTQLGQQLFESTGATDEDNPAAQMVESEGGGKGFASKQTGDVTFDQPTTPPEVHESLISEVPEESAGFAGLSEKDASRLAQTIINPPAHLAVEGRNVFDARNDSEISNPKDDLEFQAVKKDLAKILLNTLTDYDASKLTENQIYSIYANLDKLTRDSQPIRSSYREANDRIRSVFNNTVNWLGGQGVDVRLIQQNVDSAVEFLRSQWGRSIMQEDGRRMIILSMQDVTRPSRENLRTLFHEVAHQLFAQEPSWIQRLTHEAVDRLTDLQLDVFSKTYDKRLLNREPMPAHVLMEEVLAEHLAFTGIEQARARSIGQKLIDGFQKLIAQAALVVGKLTGRVYAPELVAKYSELRFQDVLDRVLNPKTDLDTMSGNIQHTAQYEATLYKQVGGKLLPERYDPATGANIIHDAIDESTLASMFNLDNKLQFSDVVVRDSRADLKKQIWTNEFGISDEPTSLGTVLRKIVDNPKVTEPELKAAAMSILDRSPLASAAQIKFISTPEEIKGLQDNHPAGTAGAYLAGPHAVLINHSAMGGFDHNDVAYLVAHEATHAAVVRAMDAYGWYKTFKNEYASKRTGKIAGAADLADFLAEGGGKSLTPKEREKWAGQILDSVPHVEKLEKIYNFLKDKSFNDGAYGMTNVDEFAAEAVSNRVFQMALAKEKLPDNLRVKREKQSVFSSIVELVSRMFNADKKGNALESVTSAMEQIMLVADPLSRRGELNSMTRRSYALPLTQMESDMKVQKDFEYEFAHLNSQSDFYHGVLDKAATQANMSFGDYLKKILGIYNPEKSIAALQDRLKGLNRPIPVNTDFRLGDSKGTSNRVAASEDRAQITKRLVGTATDAIVKTQTKALELKNSIEGHEKEVTRIQNRFVRFETMLNDVLALRDNALETMRKGLHGAERNAERLAQWSARHDGLAGIAAELFKVRDEESIPEDYAELLIDSLDGHTHDTYFTDILTKLSKENVDFDGQSPTQIEQNIREVAARTRDEQLMSLSDGSPQAKADLALLTYYAKTQPADMAALAIRVEEDPEKKDAILRTIKKIIRSNYTTTEGLNDLFKDVRTGDVRVGKAKQALTEISKQLSQSKAQLESAKLRSTEMEAASKALQEGLRTYQANTGIRATRFEPYDGATVLLTKDAGVKAPEKGTIKLGPTSSSEVAKIMMDNKKWLDTNESVRDPTWHAINDQYEGLKRVSYDQLEGTYRTNFLDKMLGSMPDRLDKTGIPIARLAGDRIRRFFSARVESDRIVLNGGKISLALKDAMVATGLAKSYSGFKDGIFNPAAHFLRHLNMLPSASEEENLQYARSQLKQFFARSEFTRTIMQKPDAFEKVWNLLYTNWKLGSKPSAEFAAKHGALVEDDEVKVVNPRTGLVENAQRPAMNVGLFTTQSFIGKVFGVKKILDAIKGDDGVPIWAKWAESKQVPQDLSKVFTDDAIYHFVRPFIYDTGTAHFSSPELLDGVTKNRANPLNVQAAFEAANGDMTKFANNLFDLEYTLKDQGDYVDHNSRRQEFVQNTLDFFRDKYDKISNMSKKQEQINAKLGPYLLSSPMMDNVKAGDFPPEFMDYNIYDQHTLRQVLSNLAAHGTLGRDLGMFTGEKEPNKGILWELNAARSFLHTKEAEYAQLAASAKRENPSASVEDIDNYIKKQVGESKLKEYKNLVEAQKELRAIEGNVIGHFSSPNGTTREMQVSQELVRTITSSMLSNFKSAINASSQVFEPFMVYGFSKTAFKQSGRYIDSVAKAGIGSFVQAITGEAKLANEYTRFMNEIGEGLDPANYLTSAQIMSDRGKNNLYENAKALGWLRRGRGLVFDTGFKGQEGERIAPAFRPWAPFSMMMIATNQGAIESQLRLFNDVLKAGMSKMDQTPGARTDPSFKFTHTDVNFAANEFDALAYDRLADQFRRMGTTIESETRQLLDARDQGKPLGNIVVSPDLARLIAGEALRLMSLPNDISSAPTWFSNHPVGRLAMPLLTWSVNKTNQLVNTIREPGGEISKRAAYSAVAAMALGMVPASMAISLLTDQYDEQITGKKSNLIGYNFDSPSQTAAALIERVGRVGTFGLAGDVVNGIRAYGMDGDLRSLSVDQRVVFINELHQVMSLASVLYNQEGNLTYDTFYRPLINALGGGGILQNQQILNNITNSVMGAPIFQLEADTTARLNAINYLRGAGRVSGLDVRTQSGESSLPTPIKPYISAMVNAAFGNDQSRFAESYAQAIVTAKEMGKPNPAEYVKTSFESYHPLRTTFKTPPTTYELGQMYGAMSDKGKEDVTSALNMFNQYGAQLGIKPYDGKVQPVAKPAPSAFSPAHL